MKLLHTLFFSLLLAAQSAHAFTQSELDALKTAVQDEPSMQSCLTAGNDVCVADWFNTESTFIVWKTTLNESDITQSDAFAFNLVDGLTAGKRDEWSSFLFKTGSCDPSKPNIRAGILDVWSGTAAKTAVYNAIIELSKRPAKNAERILAVGTGTNATPGNMTWEGRVSPNDIYIIMGR